MAQVVEICPHGGQEWTGVCYIVNRMAPDGVETQGARASAAMVLTYLS